MTISELQRSRDKNASGAMLLLGMAVFKGDALSETLARAILQECGYPGGEGAPSVNEAMAAIAARDEPATASKPRPKKGQR